MQPPIITASAATTIPTPKFFDSLWIEAHPNPFYASTYFIVRGRLPVTPDTYFRLFTSADGEAFRVDDNVYTEEFFNNGKVNFSIVKGTQIGAAPDLNPNFAIQGYWNIEEDTICTVKLSTLDKPHYEFWRTLQENRQSQGNPFSSLVYVKSNINGFDLDNVGGDINRFNLDKIIYENELIFSTGRKNFIDDTEFLLKNCIVKSSNDCRMKESESDLIEYIFKNFHRPDHCMDVLAWQEL